MRIPTKELVIGGTSFVIGFAGGWTVRGAVDKRHHDKIAAQSLIKSLQLAKMQVPDELAKQAGMTVAPQLVAAPQPVAAPAAPQPVAVQPAPPAQPAAAATS